MTKPSTQEQVSFLLLPLQAPSNLVTSAHLPPNCLARVTKETLGVSIYCPTGKEVKAAEAPASPSLETSPLSTPYGTGEVHESLLASILCSWPVGTWPYLAFPPGTPFCSGSCKGKAHFGLGPSGQTSGPVPHHQQLGQGAAGEGLGQLGHLGPGERDLPSRGSSIRGNSARKEWEVQRAWLSNSVHRCHLQSKLNHGPVSPRGSDGQAGVDPKLLHFSQRPGEVDTASQTTLPNVLATSHM